MIPQGALSDVTVLDLSRQLPGPYCSMILADHGARVIAIEDKKLYANDGIFQANIYRNKEHMTLNLKSEKGKQVFSQLLKEADVVIEGYRPGVVKRLGVDYDSVRKIKPDIIYCSITGYGQTGPFSQRAGHDVNYLGYSGVLGFIGEKGRSPVIPGTQMGDIAGGGFNAVSGILLALYAREKTGKGQCIDISITDSMVGFLPLLLTWQQDGQSIERSDSILSHRYAAYNIYETSDGRHMAVGALEEKFWKSLCDHLGLGQYANLRFDEDRKEEIIQALRKAFLQKTMAQWEQELGRMDVCVGSISNLDEVMENPHFKEREMVVDLTNADGESEKVLGISIKLSENPGVIKNSSISYGADTKMILKECGYTDDQIRQFSKEDVI